MKNSLIKTLVLPVSMAVALFATSGVINAEQAAKKEAGASVKIAGTKQYTATAPDKLGVNEDNKGLEIGVRIKDFSIKDVQGNPYPIKNAWRDKPALVVFYRGGWCPYCNMQVRELAESYPKLRAAGVQPVLISVDEPDKSAMMSAEYQIPFPVLSDPDLAAHNTFNVVLTLDAATLKKYKKWGIDLSQWSGQNHNSFAVASAFLIDQQGRVLMSHAVKDYRSRPSTEQLLSLIKKYVK